eukprot:479340_1
MGGMGGMMGGKGEAFRDKALGSLKIVHDCKLRASLMRRMMARRRPRMRRGPTQMEQMMQMMMMMKMMFPDKHSKKMGHVHKMCRYYTCIVKTQQSQLSQLMNMMMMSANVNQAPITITD